MSKYNYAISCRRWIKRIKNEIPSFACCCNSRRQNIDVDMCLKFILTRQVLVLYHKNVHCSLSCIDLLLLFKNSYIYVRRTILATLNVVKIRNTCMYVYVRDSDGKKLSKKSDFVCKYIIAFHLSITGHWSPVLCER